MKSIRSAAKAIIVEDGHLLTVKMRDPEGIWYALPGGGQHWAEPLHEALRRECLEELGVEIEIGPLRFVRDYIADNHEFADEDSGQHGVELMFVCKIVRGEPGRGTDPDPGQLGLEWLPVDTLEEHRLYPKSLRPLVRRMDDASVPVYLVDVN